MSEEKIEDIGGSRATNPKMNPWHPITDIKSLKILGKLIEELGELQAAAARCIIQGIESSEPITGKSNRIWLEEELADVMAGVALTKDHFNLDEAKLFARMDKKVTGLRLWHGMT